MNSLFESSAASVPFPLFPAREAGRIAAARAGFRGFGITEGDLAIDFTGDNPAALITRILEQCTVDPENVLPAGFFRDLSVGKRIECLLALAMDREGAFSIPFHCSGCGEELELELTPGEIAKYQQEADKIETIEVELPGRTLTLRKPAGRDQESWSGAVFGDEREAAEEMVRGLTLVPGGTGALKDTDLGLIEEAMDNADPLVNFLCRIECSECGHLNEFPVDLCDTALGRLARLQKHLIVMVHRLASHYHWSEKDIFDIPHWRRLEYLELIAAAR